MSKKIEYDVKDNDMKNVLNNNPFMVNISGSVNMCMIRCGQEIDKCNSVKIDTMTNYGNILALNPGKSTSIKCKVELLNNVIDDDRKNDDIYEFKNIFVTVPALHKINDIVYDMETFIIFKSANGKYVVLCTLSSGTDNVNSGDPSLLNYKLMNELFSGKNTVPEIYGTTSIKLVPNPIDLNTFIPNIGNRSFYSYIHPNNMNTDIRVFQKTMSIGNNILSILKNKLSPGNKYVNNLNIVKSSVNPSSGLYFYYSKDLTEGYKGFAVNKPVTIPNKKSLTKGKISTKTINKTPTKKTNIQKKSKKSVNKQIKNSTKSSNKEIKNKNKSINNQIKKSKTSKKEKFSNMSDSDESENEDYDKQNEYFDEDDIEEFDEDNIEEFDEDNIEEFDDDNIEEFDDDIEEFDEDNIEEFDDDEIDNNKLNDDDKMNNNKKKDKKIENFDNNNKNKNIIISIFLLVFVLVINYFYYYICKSILNNPEFKPLKEYDFDIKNLKELINTNSDFKKTLLYKLGFYIVFGLSIFLGLLFIILLLINVINNNENLLDKSNILIGIIILLSIISYIIIYCYSYFRLKLGISDITASNDNLLLKTLNSYNIKDIINLLFGKTPMIDDSTSLNDLLPKDEEPILSQAGGELNNENNIVNPLPPINNIVKSDTNINQNNIETFVNLINIKWYFIVLMFIIITSGLLLFINNILNKKDILDYIKNIITKTNLLVSIVLLMYFILFIGYNYIKFNSFINNNLIEQSIDIKNISFMYIILFLSMILLTYQIKKYNSSIILYFILIFIFIFIIYTYYILYKNELITKLLSIISISYWLIFIGYIIYLFVFA